MSEQEQKDTAAAVPPKDAAAVDAAAATPVAAAGETDAPVVPETYPIALPDGTKLAPESVARITEKAKALKVTDPTLAQAMLDAAHGEVNETLAAYEAAHREGGEAWKRAVEANDAAALAHPDLGNGSKAALDAKAVQAGLVLQRYGGEATMQTLKAAGLLNHPDLLVLLTRIHDATREKPAVEPYKGKMPEKVETYEERMYGSKKAAAT